MNKSKLNKVHLSSFYSINRKANFISDFCVCLHGLRNNQFHTGILDLPPEGYFWGNWMLHCSFPEKHRISTNTTPFLYHGHYPIHLSVSQQSFAKTSPNYTCKCNYFNIRTTIQQSLTKIGFILFAKS